MHVDAPWMHGELDGKHVSIPLRTRIERTYRCRRGGSPGRLFKFVSIRAVLNKKNSQRGEIERGDQQTLQLAITRRWERTVCGHALTRVRLDGCGLLKRAVGDCVEPGGEDKGAVAQPL